MWVYAAEQHGDVMFDFTRGRGGDGPRRVLAGFKGYLQADAYSAYDNLFGSGDIVEVGCMAHARRKFRDALDTAPEFARPAMQAIQALYHVERQCKALELSNDQRFAKRQVESKSTFDALRAWIAELKSRTLPKSPIGKATKPLRPACRRARTIPRERTTRDRQQPLRTRNAPGGRGSQELVVRRQ
ncbi:MAG: transposase [Planctomycetota bacterium]